MEELTIGEVARRTGLATSAIRYYEQLGLLPPPLRVNGRRRYDARVFQQLVVIRLARHAGFGMRAIQALVTSIGGDTDTSPSWKTLAVEHAAALEAQIARIQAHKAWLLAALHQPCAPQGECITVTSDERDGALQITLRNGALPLPEGFISADCDEKDQPMAALG